MSTKQAQALGRKIQQTYQFRDKTVLALEKISKKTLRPKQVLIEQMILIAAAEMGIITVKQLNNIYKQEGWV